MEQLKNIDKKRESNFELLRIVAMIMIILHHYVYYGGVAYTYGAGINRYFGIVLLFIGKTGVNIFILITGYFLINSSFKIKKLFKLIFQVFFYSIFAIFIRKFIYKDVSMIDIINNCFPMLNNVYWFFSIYIGIYILSPFINKFIKTIDKKKMEILIIILFFMLSVIPTFGFAKHFVGNLQIFILVYLIGAYFRLYGNSFITLKQIKLGIVSVIALLIVFIILASASNTNLILYANFAKDIYYILIFVLAIFIFLYFKELKIKQNKVINFFAKGSFAVYLIHDNPNLRNLIWKDILKASNFCYSNLGILILHMIFSVCMIYLIGCVIEIIRINLLEKTILKIKTLEKFENKVDTIMEVE